MNLRSARSDAGELGADNSVAVVATTPGQSVGALVASVGGSQPAIAAGSALSRFGIGGASQIGSSPGYTIVKDEPDPDNPKVREPGGVVGVNVLPDFIRHTQPVARAAPHDYTPISVEGPLLTPTGMDGSHNVPIFQQIAQKFTPPAVDPPLLTPTGMDPNSPTSTPVIPPPLITPIFPPGSDTPTGGSAPGQAIVTPSLPANPLTNTPGTGSTNTAGAGLSGNGPLIDALTGALMGGGFQSPMDATSSPGAAAIQAIQPQSGSVTSSGNMALIVAVIAAVGVGGYFLLKKMKHGGK